MSQVILSVFQFDDETLFFKHWMDSYKQRGNSYKSFAEKIGLKSSGFISDILKSKKNISQQRALAFAKAMDLTPEESDFFILLVQKRSCKNTQEQQKLQEQIGLAQLAYKNTACDQASSSYFSDINNILIREYILAKGCIYDVREIQRDFSILSIDLVDIKRILKQLQDLGFIAFNGTSKTWEPRLNQNQHLTMGEVPQKIIDETKENLVQLISQAQTQIPKEERNISFLIKAVSPEQKKEVFKLIEQCRSKIQLLKNDTPASDLLLLNFSAFPIASWSNS